MLNRFHPARRRHRQLSSSERWKTITFYVKNTDVSNAVAGLTTLALNGDICHGMDKYIAGANLIPLEKVGGVLRPIAVGEVWQRLFAKVIMRSQRI
jgi:hypothetical protein